MNNVIITLTTLFCLSACHSAPKRNDNNTQDISSAQKELESEGWQFDTPNGGEFDKSYGVTPVRGLQDNYFDITVGKGYSVAIKIMDARTINIAVLSCLPSHTALSNGYRNTRPANSKTYQYGPQASPQ